MPKWHECPTQSGPGTGEKAPAIAVDIAAASFADLADRLGAGA